MSSDTTNTSGDVDEGADGSAAIAAAVARVERTFADCADDALMQELCRLAMARAEQGVIR